MKYMGNKSIIFYSIKELETYREMIISNLQKGYEQIKKLTETEDALSFFRMIKFKKTAVEPFTGKPENFIEVVNQSQTCLVSIMATEYLFERYKDSAFRVNFGNSAG